MLIPDWKFVITLVATLAGILVPVWLWQADQSLRSLRLQLVSTTELRPQDTASLDGIRISLDGKDLERPFISVLELSNNGTQPILQAEFEASIEISAQTPARVVKVQVTSIEPADLRPVTSAASGVISVQPLLLNPKDTIRLNILTSDASPVFTARSRIAGISSIKVSDLAGTKATRIYWMKSITSELLTIVYVVITMGTMANMLFRFRWIVFEPIILLPTAIIASVGGILLIMPLEGDITMYEAIARLVLAIMIAAPILFFLSRKLPP